MLEDTFEVYYLSKLAKNKLKSSSTHAGRTVGGGKASSFCFLRVKTDRERRFL